MVMRYALEYAVRYFGESANLSRGKVTECILNRAGKVTSHMYCVVINTKSYLELGSTTVST